MGKKGDLWKNYDNEFEYIYDSALWIYTGASNIDVLERYPYNIAKGIRYVLLKFKQKEWVNYVS